MRKTYYFFYHRDDMGLLPSIHKIFLFRKIFLFYRVMKDIKTECQVHFVKSPNKFTGSASVHAEILLRLD